jgi:hypothetical protein
VDVTIKDQRPKEPLVTKNVSIVVASGEQGRVRTFVTSRGSAASLNVDAYPAVQDDDSRIALRIGLEYRHPKPSSERTTEADKPAFTEPSNQPVVPMPVVLDREAETRVDESIWVVLDDGKPMLVTQSADPLTDRKVTVEVKATILR